MSIGKVIENLRHKVSSLYRLDEARRVHLHKILQANCDSKEEMYGLFFEISNVMRHGIRLEFDDVTCGLGRLSSLRMF